MLAIAFSTAPMQKLGLPSLVNHSTRLNLYELELGVQAKLISDPMRTASLNHSKRIEYTVGVKY